MINDSKNTLETRLTALALELDSQESVINELTDALHPILHPYDNKEVGGNIGEPLPIMSPIEYEITRLKDKVLANNILLVNIKEHLGL